MPAPGQGLVRDAHPAVGGETRPAACSCSAARSSSSIVSGATDEQIRTSRRAELGHQVELVPASAARRLRTGRRCALRVPERLVQLDAHAEVGDPCADVCGDPATLAIRSFSKISTPSNPAAAAASRRSSRVPDRHTVAIDRGAPNHWRLRPRPPPRGQRGRSARASGRRPARRR